MTEENKGAAMALPEPTAYMHTQNAHVTVTFDSDSPFANPSETSALFTADQMLAFRAEGEAALRARLAAAEAEQTNLVRLSRDIVRYGAVHDIGGGDVAFETLADYLKIRFPEDLGELTLAERRQLSGQCEIAKLRAQRDEAVAALEHIETLAAKLRHGGPDSSDLNDLSDALQEATDVAHEALASLKEQAA